MGTPLPPNLPANDCTSCWGVGKPFGDTPTPKVIEVRLTRLLPGEFWNPVDEQLLLTTHYLEQHAFPCVWSIVSGPFDWTLNFNDQFTLLEVKHTASNKLVFIDDEPPACEVDFPSRLTVPTNNFAWNGFANITWNPEDLE